MKREKTLQELFDTWEPICEAGPNPIKDFEQKKTMCQLLENTAVEFEKAGLLTEATGMKQADGLGPSPISKDGKKSTGYLTGDFGREKVVDHGNMYLPNVIMPMVRRIFPSLIAHELVGVQALNGPVGYALAYRAKYGATSKKWEDGSVRDAEMAFNPVDTRHTGTLTSDVPLTSLTGDAIQTEGEYPAGYTAPTAKEAWEAYSGTSGKAWAGTGVRTSDGEYLSFSAGEWPTVSFDFLKQMVEVRTRKLGAGWSPELAEDMEAMHNFDVESEFVNMISYEIGAEIDRQIVTEMAKAAITGGSITSWDPSKADGIDQLGRLQTLFTQITMEAQQIALRTRRGHANFVITSPRVTALLESMNTTKYVSFDGGKNIPSVPDSGVGALVKCGLLNDRQQLLLRDTYAAKDYLLMGYKGAHPADNGIIYCPYIPVQLQKVMDPDTLTPRVGARTRYGIMNSVWDAKNYYHFITIKGLTTPYKFNAERQFVQPYSKITNGTLFV